MKSALALLALASFAFGAAEEPAELRAAFAAQAEAVSAKEAAHNERVLAARKSYEAELSRLEKLSQAAGHLEDVLAIRAERQRMDRVLTASERAQLSETTRNARAAFDALIAKSTAQLKAEVALQQRAYASVLHRMQADLTRAGRIDDAVQVKAALASLTSTRDPEFPPSSGTGAGRLESSPGSPPPGGPSITVAKELRAKSVPAGVHPGAIPFHAPNSDRRDGANGILLKNSPSAGEQGTTWQFQYRRTGSADSLHIIHPRGNGQFIVHLRQDGVAASTPKQWAEIGWGKTGDVAVKVEPSAKSEFPLKDDVEYEVVSRLWPGGGYDLTINGKLVATAQAKEPQPLSMELPPDRSFPLSGQNSLPFSGAGFPRQWDKGFAALIIGPVATPGAHACREVQFMPGIGRVAWHK